MNWQLIVEYTMEAIGLIAVLFCVLTILAGLYGGWRDSH